MKKIPLKDQRILVAGADGLIGRTLFAQLQKRGARVWGTSRRKDIPAGRVYLDLEENRTQWILPENIHTAFLCFAYNSLEHCRREPEKTFELNVTRTVELAEYLAGAGTQVVFFSTNLVFDGAKPFEKSESPTNPQTEHGRQKAEAENRLLELGDKISILRLTKIFGPDTRLLQDWISAINGRKIIEPMKDKMVSPLSLHFTLDVLCRLAESSTPGILQISGNRDISYSQVAERLAAQMGLSRELVKPIASQVVMPQLEHNPRYTTLDASRLTGETGLIVPDVWETIDEVIEQNIGTFRARPDQAGLTISGQGTK